jgi:hypothetical protein
MHVVMLFIIEIVMHLTQKHGTIGVLNWVLVNCLDPELCLGDSDLGMWEEGKHY